MITQRTKVPATNRAVIDCLHCYLTTNLVLGAGVEPATPAFQAGAGTVSAPPGDGGQKRDIQLQYPPYAWPLGCTLRYYVLVYRSGSPTTLATSLCPPGLLVSGTCDDERAECHSNSLPR